MKITHKKKENLKHNYRTLFLNPLKSFSSKDFNNGNH